MNAREWALLLVLSAIWGSSFVFLKVLVQSLPPLTIVFGRLAIAAIALNLTTGGAVFRRELLRRWPDFFFYAFLSTALPFSLITFGETKITSGLASILNATTPIFAVVMAHLFTADDRLSWNKAVGIGAGVAGVAVLMGPAAFSGLGGMGAVLGEAACVVASLAYGTGSVVARRFRGLPPLHVVAGQLTAASLMMLPVCLVFDRPWTLSPPPAVAWTSLAGLGLLCTAFAFWLYFRILATVSATTVSLVTLLSPPFTLLLGMAFLGEQPGWRSLAGLALIGAGLIAIDGRLAKRLGSASRRQVAPEPGSADG